MKNGAMTKLAAIGAAVGFAGLAVFQLLLAVGAPLGEAAWGGATEGRLPPGLRVGSAISIIPYAVAAAVILRRAGFGVRWPSRTTARIGTWVLVVLMIMGTLVNLLSQSPWERFLLGPIALVLAGLCLVVAIGATDDDAGLAPGELERRPAAQATPSNRVEESR